VWLLTQAAGRLSSGKEQRPLEPVSGILILYVQARILDNRVDKLAFTV